MEISMTADANAQELVPLSFEETTEDPEDSIALGGGEALPIEQEAHLDEIEAVLDVPVKVKAVLGGARVPVGELIRMRSGSVLELDRRVGEPVDVYVNGRMIARGELVLIDGLLGVTLTEIVKQDA
jgi:flagellar motor switch protein FliN/FliY